MKSTSRVRPKRPPSRLADKEPQSSLSSAWEARICELELCRTELESENRKLRAVCQQLEVASASYAKKYDLAPIGLVTLDTRGTILSINRTMAALLRRDQGSLLRRRFEFLVSPEDVPKFTDLLRDARKSRKMVSREVRLRGAFGEPILVQLGTLPVLDERSRVAQLEITVLDLTQRKNVEVALRTSEQNLRTLIETSPHPIQLMDASARWVLANPAALELFELAGVDYHSKRIRDLAVYSPFYRRVLKAREVKDRLVLETGRTSRNDECIPKPDGSSRSFDVIRVPLHEPNGKPKGLAVLSYDLTERKQTEELLREAHEDLELRVSERTAKLTEANSRLKAEVAQRKRAEQALRASTEGFRLLVQGVQDCAIYILDIKGRVASWNSGAERIKGYGAKEIIGRHFSRFFPQTDVQAGRPQRLLRTAAKLGQVEDEGWRLRKDGSRFWARAVITALRDELGRLRGFSKLTRDITERRLAQEALRESENRLRAILDNSPSMIFLKDARGRYLHFNRQFEQVFKVPLAKSVGKMDAEIFSRAQAAAFRANDRKVLKSGVPLVFDEVALHDDGLHSNIVTKYPLRDSDGKIYAIGGIVTDITERKRAEESLRENEKHLADFFEQAPLGLFWVSTDGRVQRVNHAQLILLGCTLKECEGRSVSDFFADPELAVEALARLARHGKLENLRARFRRRDRSIRHVLIDANGLWRGDTFIASRWFVRDITYRVDLEQEILAISERERNRLGHDLHDDLCQQLSGIEFLSQTLAGQLSANSPDEAVRAREIAGMIRQAVEHTRHLARGLSPLQLEEDGIVMGLRELADRTQRLFHITCRFRGEAPALRKQDAVGIHLYRIAQEAINNAIKHGKARHIDIDLAVRAGAIILAVRDNGVGFPLRPHKRKSMGLRVMQYRASVLGGSLLVHRRVNGGTTVVCTVKTDSGQRLSRKGETK
jgi:PAS domain S-box-containing protein